MLSGREDSNNYFEFKSGMMAEVTTIMWPSDAEFALLPQDVAIAVVRNGYGRNITDEQMHRYNVAVDEHNAEAAALNAAPKVAPVVVPASPAPVATVSNPPVAATPAPAPVIAPLATAPAPAPVVAPVAGTPAPAAVSAPVVAPAAVSAPVVAPAPGAPIAPATPVVPVAPKAAGKDK